MRVEKTVFISYRRTNFPWALAIFQHLTAHGYDVFFDFKGIASGDFERVILENIRARAHFLVLLTPSALKKSGLPGDWLRREIEAALDTQRNIVPLMLERFNFGAPSIAKHLTGKIATLTRYNALPVPAEYFDEAMGRLRERYLNVPLDTVLHPSSPVAGDFARQQQRAATLAPAVEERELTAQEYFEQAFEANDPGEALRLYSSAIRLQPDFALAFNNRGALRRDYQGDVAGAREDYDTAIRVQPDLAMAFSNRGNLRAQQGDVAGAREDFDTAIRLQPDDADTFIDRGKLRRGQGDLAGAREDYNAAIRLQPDFASAFFNRGILRAEQGDVAGAREDFDTAIRLKPDDAKAFDNRAKLRVQQGDVGAREDYDTAIRLQPDFADAFNGRGFLRSCLGDIAGAREDYNAAIRLQPDFALAFTNRGILREDQGDFAGAREDYDTAIHLQPDDGGIFSNRGILRVRQGDVAGAREDFDTAIRLKPDDAGIFNNRGNLHAQQGDVAGAREDYDTAIRLQPDFADAFDNRGRLRKEQGDIAGAQLDFNMVKRLAKGQFVIAQKLVAAARAADPEHDFEGWSKAAGNPVEQAQREEALRLVEATSPRLTPDEAARTMLVRKALEGFKGWNLLFLAPEIPDRKSRNARSRCQIPRDEELLAILDLSNFGSAKCCWAFTDVALYVSGRVYFSSYTTMFKYEDLPQLTFHNLWIGDGLSARAADGSATVFHVSPIASIRDKSLAILAAIRAALAS